MHRNTYDHESSEVDYRRMVSNIAYRFGLDIHEEKDVIWRDGEVFVDGDIVARNTIWYRAWMLLREEFDDNGYN